MNVPRHLAVIMDGNGRWAQKRLLPRSAGHRAGLKRMISLTEHAFSRGVEVVTVYALSTENLARPQEELDGLFGLFREYFTKQVAPLKQMGIVLKAIGDLSLLPDDVAALAREGERDTAAGTNGTFVIALGYGGRQDILSAVNAAVRAGRPVGEGEFASLLSTGGLPAPDLLIRTGGEKRLSNFLLFECAYTEFLFSEKMFPAFTNGDLDRALADYASRERRFGKITT